MPIETDFQKKRKKADKKEGITIWGPIEPPQKLGIYGTYVAVDWDLCTGCSKCINICPTQVYEWRDTPGHPTSERKPFPIKELDCVQCYKCESECPDQAIRIIFGGAYTSTKIILLTMFAQIFLGIIYGTLFGPFLGLRIPLFFGWFIALISSPFFFATAIYFPKEGKPQEGKSSMDVTAVVDTGLYSIIRHPQYLGCILMMFASILVSQHWLSAIVGVSITFWLFSEIPKEEEALILKFGDDYRSYMERVPRLNPLPQVIRLLLRK
jgi:protein-S-isoprenylcysteine O-methyltransferase Ste14/NAD-dependent dihydropyrimidine dehydrogenase PreA subunit